MRFRQIQDYRIINCCRFGINGVAETHIDLHGNAGAFQKTGKFYTNSYIVGIFFYFLSSHSSRIENKTIRFNINATNIPDDFFNAVYPVVKTGQKINIQSGPSLRYIQAVNISAPLRINCPASGDRLKR